MRFRMIVFICFIVAMMAVFALRLYKLQTAELVTADADSMTYRTTMEASRGNILDRNGNVLVSNRASYNLVIINFVFFNAPDPNGNLLKVLNDPAFRKEIAHFSGNDYRDLGKIITEV